MYKELQEFAFRHRNARYFDPAPRTSVRRIIRGNVIMSTILAVALLVFMWRDGLPKSANAVPFLLGVSALLIAGVYASVWDAVHYRYGWEYKRGTYSKLFSYSNAYEVIAVVRKACRGWEYELFVEDIFNTPNEPSYITVKRGAETTLDEALVQASVDAWLSLEGEWD